MKYKLNRVGKWKLKIVKSLICASVKIHIFAKFKNPNPIKIGLPLRLFHLLMQWLTPFVWTKYLIASCNVYLKQEDNRNYYYCGVLIKTFGFCFFLFFLRNRAWALIATVSTKLRIQWRSYEKMRHFSCALLSLGDWKSLNLKNKFQRKCLAKDRFKSFICKH